MFRIPIALKLVPGRAGVVARLLALLVVCGNVTLAHAACFNSPDPAIARLQALAAQDGNAALARADKALRDADLDKSSAVRRAWLQAVRAQAFSALELDPDARDAAKEGLRLVPDNSQDVHLALMTILAENVYDAAGIEVAVRSIEVARAGQVAGSIADSCLLTTLGMLQFRQDRADLAIATLSQAYRASDSPAR